VNTLHAANEQRMQIQGTKVIMPVITWKNGFIFTGYFMTVNISDYTHPLFYGHNPFPKNCS